MMHWVEEPKYPTISRDSQDSWGPFGMADWACALMGLEESPIFQRTADQTVNALYCGCIL